MKKIHTRRYSLYHKLAEDITEKELLRNVNAMFL